MDSKAKILTAALTLFRTEGFHGTSTAKIAKEAGVSNGTLFHHFKTKEELINTLYLQEKEAYKEYVLNELPDFSPTKKYMRTMWMRFLQHDLEHLERVTFNSMYANSPYIDSLSREEASRYFSFVVENIERLIENEVVINSHPRLLVSTFYASVLAAYRFINDHDIDNEEEQKEIAFSMWWRSVVNI
ncbi:MAG: TetR/AcrR family transcriptional regulator [Turicibacter sp.]|nr:TetR/AcrR family transcriptional regulator [Turicibacter sp.]